MEMEDEDARVEHIRKRKMQNQEKVAEAKKAEEQLKSTLRMVLDEPAYARIMNVKMANQQMFTAAVQYLLRAFQRFQRKITEEELLSVLHALKERSEKKTKITFERK